MNCSWLAYENGLELLSERIPLGHPEHERMHALRSRLLENITQASSYRDTPELYTSRKSLIMDLNSIMKQVTRMSFIELCVSTSPVLEYITSAYRVAQQACRLFSSEEVIWSDQCRDIVKQFHERLTLDAIAADISDTTIDLYDIDRCVADLTKLIEDFEKYCPPRRKPTERLQDKRTKIRDELKQCVEKMQYIDNASFAELIWWYQEAVLSIRIGQAFPDPLPQSPSQQEQVYPSSSAHDGSGDNDNAPSKAQVDVAEQEKQHQASNQQPAYRQEEKPSESDIDITILREKMVLAFSLEELGVLCADIRQALRHNGIDEQFNLDMLEGAGLTGKVQGLINYCERRGWLGYLVIAVRKVRHNLGL